MNQVKKTALEKSIHQSRINTSLRKLTLELNDYQRTVKQEGKQYEHYGDIRNTKQMIIELRQQLDYKIKQARLLETI